MSTRGANALNSRSRPGLSINPNRHGSNPSIERHLKILHRPTRLRPKPLRITPDIDYNLLRPIRSRHNRDNIPSPIRSRLCATLTPNRASVTPAPHGRGPIPSHDTVFMRQRQVAVARLVGLDEPGQHGPEPGMVVVLGVLFGAMDDVRRVRVADVARLAVVVPGDDFDEVGHDF